MEREDARGISLMKFKETYMSLYRVLQRMITLEVRAKTSSNGYIRKSRRSLIDEHR